jgi:hypothetical protein
MRVCFAIFLVAATHVVLLSFLSTLLLKDWLNNRAAKSLRGERDRGS